jgi:hypothetical protein
MVERHDVKANVVKTVSKRFRRTQTFMITEYHSTVTYPLFWPYNTSITPNSIWYNLTFYNVNVPETVISNNVVWRLKLFK